ncbi:hypothetical protein NIES2135_05140 [Leptolyngbya boryana NIES-2135]|jgi:GTPase SAR1 family protein|uniref:KAP NTPase domain-containing protein n=1 Tax=Leptolyngbya boryana NIES-2135 TaxID=1973484 RepID=A0A1Z4JAA9_LEPBY|nr:MULTISPECIES: P-loop NTPase fold protein [Leptolyngbya]BAY53704.1 hypothetical protein NIES2135_05140 [Leptolyngbya boryana NIES-2135]MBD2367855.1 AAA family ATPase [Leptolyngbya sp. FACHB-161]MBD2374297.1 AAA family ATPase [Leptolyngbya sp. FACHB-238]MBD2398519.1 AAA family ATPase [Leptolyngbya sp. FACHB-239]MBD2406221.1 AAA family ATPase [Leptolyngbya sp. FACHB-402]
MSQEQKTINSHIETYLDYYCNLSHAPGFAVLLQGQWGSGKTWFINRYREKLKENNHKCLYVSLYGMTSFSEIENAFFQQLHPVLSSKGMAITGKIIKGLLKGTLKIDLNSDSKDDGTLNLQIPEINLPEYLRDADKSILIFDDLERCNIDLVNILGYINFFVEHQELKVILIANEDELVKDTKYQIIKEKLIGKTFGVSLDFEGALENFIAVINNLNARRFLSDNTELIQNFYGQAGYENLRNLKQIVLDFERIFNVLPEKAKDKVELAQDLLKLLIAFSIEIKRGNILPKDISKLRETYSVSLSTRIASQALGTGKDEDQENTPLQEVLNRYPSIDLRDPFPSELWWQVFFDKGIVDIEELAQSILNSRYFQNENTPNWVRLWHFTDLSDDDFDSIISSVELDFSNRKYVEIGIVKHVFGLLLMFSHAGLYSKKKDEILKNTKRYIDYLKDSKQLAISTSSSIDSITDDGYGSLGFQGKEFEEFQELSSYINEVKKLAQEESLPVAGQELLTIMQSDIWKFSRMICLSEYQYEDIFIQDYHEIPILKYIEPTTFITLLLQMGVENKRRILLSLRERYKFGNINLRLIEELEWLKSVRDLLQKEVESRKGKVSGFVLASYIQYYLDEAIRKLEKDKAQLGANQQ